jgi:hypothetical protein
MFEKIVLRSSETGVALTLGEVAEALLFYRNVHLVLDPGSLNALISSLGTRDLLALVARKRMTAVYAEDMLVARNESFGSTQRHDFSTAMMISRAPNEKVRTSRRGRLELALESNGHSRGEARKLADRFIELIPIKRYSSDYFTPGGIHKAATADLNDTNYVTAAIRRVLQDQIGFEEFAENLRIEVIHLEGKFVLQSNIDFAIGNARRMAISPSLEPLTEGNLLVALLDANADVNIASLYGGDFYTSSVNSDIVRIRFSELLQRTGISVTQLQQFKDVVLPDYPTIREVINSKERSFDEFEKLLDQSDRFRRTVHQMGPDASLVEEYFKQVMREGWISSLPAKGMRYVLGLGIGTANPIAGALLGAADTFLLDKLRGWRPSHFVDGKLKLFLDTDRCRSPYDLRLAPVNTPRDSAISVPPNQTLRFEWEDKPGATVSRQSLVTLA